MHSVCEYVKIRFLRIRKVRILLVPVYFANSTIQDKQSFRLLKIVRNKNLNIKRRT